MDVVTNDRWKRCAHSFVMQVDDDGGLPLSKDVACDVGTTLKDIRGSIVISETGCSDDCREYLPRDATPCLNCGHPFSEHRFGQDTETGVVESNCQTKGCKCPDWCEEGEI